jgi:hypothetical protein
MPSFPLEEISSDWSAATRSNLEVAVAGEFCPRSKDDLERRLVKRVLSQVRITT